MKQWCKQHVWYMGALIISAVLLYAPMLLAPGFGLLNDGWYVHMSQQVGFLDFEKLTTLHNARLIPFTLFFSDGMLTLAQHSAQGLSIIYFVEILVIASLLYYLVFKSTLSKMRAFVATICILFSAAFVSNVYEFFTQDHLSLLLLLVFALLYTWLTSKVHSLKSALPAICLSIITLFCFLVTKEINVFVVGVFAGLLIYDYLTKSEVYYKKLDALYLLFSLAVLGVYIFEFSQIKSMAGSYTLSHIPQAIIDYGVRLHLNVLVALAAIGALYVRFRKSNWNLKQVISREQTMYLLIMLGSLAVYLPWGAAADRYLLLFVSFLYIFFFSFIDFSHHKKLYIPLLIFTFLANLFFVSFHVVRFYGARSGDAKLLTYLQLHKDEYDQICVQTASQSPEDILQLNLWVNDIFHLNKKICSLSLVEDETIKDYYNEAGIVYNTAGQLTDKTLFISKDHSGVPVHPLDSIYTVEILETLKTHLPNIHPTRGFEIKKFDWNIGHVHAK